jgi:hypothetical protein
MEHPSDIQNQIFQKINDQLPAHIALVDEIADVLEISTDSAYRRIRGEKQLSIHEVQKLCEKYQFSVDDLTNASINTITFRTNFVDEKDYSFHNYLNSILSSMQALALYEDAEAIFVLNEINHLQLMQVPEIWNFKAFYWQKSNMGFSEFKDKVFSLSFSDSESEKITSQIIVIYANSKSIEFTTEESLVSLLRQIQFYYEAGFFENKNDAIILCDKLTELVNHLKVQAEMGFKFPFGKPPAGKEGNFELYVNDILLTDEIILAKAGNIVTTYLINNDANLLQTFNKSFYAYNYHWCKNLMQKSTLISGIAEKERNKFFIKLHEKIQSIKMQIG